MRLINQPTAGRRPSSVQDSVHRTAQYRRPAFYSLLCASPFYYRGGLVATQTGRVPVVRASIFFAAVIDCNSIRRLPGAACAALGEFCPCGGQPLTLGRAECVAQRVVRGDRRRSVGVAAHGQSFLRRCALSARTRGSRMALAIPESSNAATHFPSPSAAVNLLPFTCSDGCRCAWHPEGVGAV